MTNKESLVTQSQASALLNVSVKTIYRLRQKGLLPTISIGKNVRIKRSDIEWLIKRKLLEDYPLGYQTTTNTNITTFSIHDKERDQKQSLRTKDRLEAETRFLGWLEQRQKEYISLATDDPIVRDCIDLWLTQQVIMFTDGVQTRFKSMVKNINAYFGDMTVSEIVRKDSMIYYEKRKAGLLGNSKAADSTIRLELSELRAVFNFMQKKVEPKQRRINSEIVPYLDIPDNSPPRDRIVTLEEQEKYIDYALNGNYNGIGVKRVNRIHRIQTFLVVAIETGARKGAILDLQWPMINFAKGIINFLPPGQRQQHQKKRPTVPMSDLLINFLKQLYEQRINNFVFENTADVLSGIDRVNSLLGIKGVTPHTFRHTWATRAAEDGVAMETIADFLGDTVETIKKNYLHLSPDYLRSAINRK